MHDGKVEWYRWIALLDGKVWWNTDEYTMAFLHSYWLYFLWHGINECTMGWNHTTDEKFKSITYFSPRMLINIYSACNFHTHCVLHCIVHFWINYIDYILFCFHCSIRWRIHLHRLEHTTMLNKHVHWMNKQMNKQTDKQMNNKSINKEKRCYQITANIKPIPSLLTPLDCYLPVAILFNIVNTAGAYRIGDPSK